MVIKYLSFQNTRSLDIFTPSASLLIIHQKNFPSIHSTCKKLHPPTLHKNMKILGIFLAKDSKENSINLGVSAVGGGPLVTETCERTMKEHNAAGFNFLKRIGLLAYVELGIPQTSD